jgi:hypothetical protein
MRSLKSEERRTVPRYSLERMAKIQLGYDAPPTYCFVTDISEGGVRLYLNGLEVPDEFVLSLGRRPREGWQIQGCLAAGQRSRRQICKLKVAAAAIAHSLTHLLPLRSA